MALAARCPHCRALFRVVADQLKLRGGLVRCGECRQVFDAIGSLSYVDDVALTKEKAGAAIGGSAHPGPAVAAHRSSAQSSPGSAAAAPAANPPPAAREAPAKPVPPRIMRPVETGRRAPREEIRDELAVPTLIGIAEPGDASDQAALESALAVAGYHRKTASAEPFRPSVLKTEEEEPTAASFLPTPDTLRAQKLTRAIAIACAPLGLLALIQLGLTLRTDALETWPSLRPLLMNACSVFGCKVGWPAHGELLTVFAGDEVEVFPGTDVIELDAAVRSRANYIMALPAIEVTLTDAQNRTIARKVFMPVDYLASSGESSSRIDEGLAPSSDLSVRLVFEARGLSPTRFSMYPFYP
jgi:predicted Zn finger-like uncharacterized protein